MSCLLGKRGGILLFNAVFYRAWLKPWTLTRARFFSLDRVSFRRKKKEDKSAKAAEKEDKAKEKTEKKPAKEEVRSLRCQFFGVRYHTDYLREWIFCMLV
jgi:hypothetical protein